MHILFYIGILLLAGILAARGAARIKLPHVTGYLIAGILIGPYFLNLIPKDILPDLAIIPEFALGFIAYTIGSTLNVKRIRKAKNGALTIALYESFGAVMVVILCLFLLFRQTIGLSIVLGAIAAATAPAATMMIIRQYRAKGLLVDTITPVVALDNAIAIVLFSIMISVARPITGQEGQISWLRVVLQPLQEIGLTLILGLIAGFLLSIAFDRIKSKEELLCIVILVISLAIGGAHALQLSSMLLCMTLGAVVSNLSAYNLKTLQTLDGFTPPIFVLFFVLASLKLDIEVFKSVGFIAVGYVMLRAAGKLLGARFGTRAAVCSFEIRRYLGWTLIPQAGVALGLSLLAEVKIPEFGGVIRTIIIASTIIYELIGPVIAKAALIKAGQIRPEH